MLGAFVCNSVAAGFPFGKVSRIPIGTTKCKIYIYNVKYIYINETQSVQLHDACCIEMCSTEYNYSINKQWEVSLLSGV